MAKVHLLLGTGQVIEVGIAKETSIMRNTASGTKLYFSRKSLVCEQKEKNTYAMKIKDIIDLGSETPS